MTHGHKSLKFDFISVATIRRQRIVCYVEHRKFACKVLASSVFSLKMVTNLKCKRQSQSERASSIMLCELLQLVKIQPEHLTGRTEGQRRTFVRLASLRTNGLTGISGIRSRSHHDVCTASRKLPAVGVVRVSAVRRDRKGKRCESASAVVQERDESKVSPCSYCTRSQIEPPSQLTLLYPL
jgi:hypothetical protein